MGVYYLKEPIESGEGGEGSAVECWVDNNYAGARVIENGADISQSMPAYALFSNYLAVANGTILQVGDDRPVRVTRVSLR